MPYSWVVKPSRVQSLSRGEKPKNVGAIDLTQDVTPSANAGAEQTEAFRMSVQEHLEIVPRLSRLRGTATKRHPVFGTLNAHGWHCMFGVHLEIHRKQAEAVMRIIKAEPGARGEI